MQYNGSILSVRLWVSLGYDTLYPFCHNAILFLQTLFLATQSTTLHFPLLFSITVNTVCVAVWQEALLDLGLYLPSQLRSAFGTVFEFVRSSDILSSARVFNLSHAADMWSFIQLVVPASIPMSNFSCENYLAPIDEKDKAIPNTSG